MLWTEGSAFFLCGHDHFPCCWYPGNSSIKSSRPSGPTNHDERQMHQLQRLADHDREKLNEKARTQQHLSQISVLTTPTGRCVRPVRIVRVHWRLAFLVSGKSFFAARNCRGFTCTGAFGWRWNLESCCRKSSIKASACLSTASPPPSRTTSCRLYTITPCAVVLRVVSCVVPPRRPPRTPRKRRWTDLRCGLNACLCHCPAIMFPPCPPSSCHRTAAHLRRKPSIYPSTPPSASIAQT